MSIASHLHLYPMESSHPASMRYVDLSTRRLPNDDAIHHYYSENRGYEPRVSIHHTNYPPRSLSPLFFTQPSDYHYGEHLPTSYRRGRALGDIADVAEHYAGRTHGQVNPSYPHRVVRPAPYPMARTRSRPFHPGHERRASPPHFNHLHREADNVPVLRELVHLSTEPHQVREDWGGHPRFQSPPPRTTASSSPITTEPPEDLSLVGQLCGKRNCYRQVCPLFGEFCEYHKPSRLCKVPECRKCAKTGGYCISHGGGRRCQSDGCTKSAKEGGYCIAHGGGKRCQAADCDKSVIFSRLPSR